MASYKLEIPLADGTTQTRTWDGQCAGTRTSPCPSNRPAAVLSGFAFNVNENLTSDLGTSSKVKDGEILLKLTAYDAVLHPSTVKNLPLKVDRDRPSVEVDGAFKPEDREWVGGGMQSLFAFGEDARSGVTSAVVKIDGNPARSAVTQPCGMGGCDLDAEIDVNTDDVNPNQSGDQPLAEGSHTVAVEVTDAAGNTSPAISWSIRHDRSAPGLSLSGSLKQAEGTLAPGTTYNLNAAATDSGSAQSGLGQITVEIDDDLIEGPDEQRCPAGSCSPLARSLDYASDDYGEGSHTVRVTAIDYAGNSSTEDLTVSNPQPTPAGCSTAPTPTTVPQNSQTTPAAALSLLGSQQGMPEMIGASTILDLDGQLISPVLADLGGTVNKLVGRDMLGSLTVDKQATDGSTWAIDTEDGPICLTPTEVSDGASAPVQPSNNSGALFANALPGIDTVVRPTVAGLEGLLQIRSASAPQAATWSVDLPPDHSLQVLANGSVAVVRPVPAGLAQPPLSGTEPAAPSIPDQIAAIGKVSTEITAASELLQRSERASDDEVVAIFRSPWARDANGGSVPADLSVVGNTIRMAINHSSAGVTYPVEADLQATSATDIDDAELAWSTAKSDVFDQDDDDAFVAALPAGTGSAPTASSSSSTASTADEPVGDYPDSGSAAREVQPEDDDATEEPIGARPPDDTKAVSSAVLGEKFSKLSIGVTESNPSTLSDPRNAAIATKNTGGVRLLRVFLPWNYMAIKDAVDSGSESRDCAKRTVRYWEGHGQGAARKPGVKEVVATQPKTELMVVLTANLYTCDQAAKSPTSYKREVRRFIQSNRVVDRISAWNEPNFYVGVHQNPTWAADYWRAARDVCLEKDANGKRYCAPGPAGDFAMGPASFLKKIKNKNGEMVRRVPYVNTYAARIRKRNSYRKRPLAWSFHPWKDAQLFSASRKRNKRVPTFNRFYRRRYSGTIGSNDYRYENKNGTKLKPAIWNTETGAHYRMACKDTSASRCSSKRILHLGQVLQAETLAYLLRASVQRLDGGATTEVNRLYYYNFQDTVGFTFPDSGPTGRCDPVGSIKRCRRTDTGLIGSDADNNRSTEGYSVVKMPPTGRNDGYTGTGDTRRAWCLLRYRVPAEIKSGRVNFKNCPQPSQSSG